MGVYFRYLTQDREFLTPTASSQAFLIVFLVGGLQCLIRLFHSHLPLTMVQEDKEYVEVQLPKIAPNYFVG